MQARNFAVANLFSDAAVRHEMRAKNDNSGKLTKMYHRDLHVTDSLI